MLEDDFGVVEGGVLGGLGAGGGDDFGVEGELEGLDATETEDLAEVFAVQVCGEEPAGERRASAMARTSTWWCRNGLVGRDFAVGEGVGTVAFKALWGRSCGGGLGV